MQIRVTNYARVWLCWTGLDDIEAEEDGPEAIWPGNWLKPAHRHTQLSSDWMNEEARERERGGKA